MRPSTILAGLAPVFALAAGGTDAVEAAAPAVDRRATPLQYRGVDWSSTTTEERDNKVRYKNVAGVEKPLEQILVDAGVNFVRQRLFTVSGDHGIAYNIALARRAVAAGLKFGINLHYSDKWTNPGLQDIPAGWPTEIGALEKKVYDYTADVCAQFAAANLKPDTITLGNEINGGLLWPTGKYDQPKNLARLLKAGSKAVRDSALGGTAKIVIHRSQGGDAADNHWFYDMIVGTGLIAKADWDVIAVSFYPFWGESATFANLKTTLSTLSEDFDKEVQVVETNWPTSCPNPDTPFPADQRSIPFSPEGQTQYLQKLAETLKSIPRATGLNYWEPAWVNNAVLGSSCESNVLFKYSGQALSSLEAFKTL